MALPHVQFDRVVWIVLNKVYILFLLFGVIAIVGSIGFTVEVYAMSRRFAENGRMIPTGIDWVQTVGKPAVIFFYACVCFLLREIILLVAVRSGVLRADDIAFAIGSKSSESMKATAHYLAYFFVCLGIFAVGYKMFSGLEIEGRTVLASLNYGLRTAVEQWFYAAVLFVLSLVLEHATSEEKL